MTFAVFLPCCAALRPVGLAPFAGFPLGCPALAGWVARWVALPLRGAARWAFARGGFSAPLRGIPSPSWRCRGSHDTGHRNIVYDAYKSNASSNRFNSAVKIVHHCALFGVALPWFARFAASLLPGRLGLPLAAASLPISTLPIYMCVCPSVFCRFYHVCLRALRRLCTAVTIPLRPLPNWPETIVNRLWAHLLRKVRLA